MRAKRKEGFKLIITLVSDVLGEENNGTTIAAMNLVNYLRKQGHTVRILCADQDKTGKENYYIVSNLNLGKLLNRYVEKAGVTLAKPDAEVIGAALEGTDHLHVMMPFGLGIKTAKIAHAKGISVTAGFHMQAQNFTAYIGMNKIEPVNRLVYHIIYHKLFQLADGIHYPTHFIQDLFERKIHRKTPGYVISNGVHDYVQKRQTEKPAGMEDKIVILTTGRYSREKSQDTLLKAVRYSQYRDRIQLILGGMGVKEKHYRRLAKKLPVPPVFRFYSRQALIDVLNCADLYVHPADAELEGIACLEAITCGKLTIVSDSKQSATREFAIDSKCIFRSRNPRDLARVIDYWIQHPAEKKAYEEAYLTRSIAYRQEECMKQMEEMIMKVHHEKREG